MIGEISERWDPVTLGILRFAMALPLVCLIASATLGWRMPPLCPEGVSWWRLLALGGLGLCGFAMLYIFALAHMDPGTAAVIAAMAPVTSGLVSLAFGDRPSKRLLIAVVLSVSGAALGAMNFDSPENLIQLRGGEPVFLVSQSLWAWYSLACRRAMPESSPAVVTYATMIPGALCLLIIWLVLEMLNLLPPWPQNAPASDYYMIAYLGLGGAALAIVFWNVGVRGLGLIASALHMNLVPLVVVLTAYALGSEPRWEQLAGGAIVIAGVIQAQLGFLLARRRLAD